MNIFTEMLEIRSNAQRANCRVKMWKLQRARLDEFAERVSSASGQSAAHVKAAIEIYGAHIFGGFVRLVD